MNNFTFFISLLSLLGFSACENHYDKGKEFKITEAETTTAYKNHEYEDSKSCRECHTLIYDEFITSMHYKSTVFRDEIHKAVWEDHPNFKNKKQYKCAQCHIPGADNIKDFMEKDGQVFPDINNPTQNEAISCAACHRIKSIEKHRLANRNIYADHKYTYYGTSTGTSPSHQTNDKNELYFNAKVCTGCHSHRENINQYVVCITESQTKDVSYETCNHPPKIRTANSFLKKRLNLLL